MPQRKKILAISGSTRSSSSNLTLIHHIQDMSRDVLDIQIFEGLAELPHFNPDHDHERSPEAVMVFRQLLREADGLLICTPEYAMGVPGTLKNALDWVVSSCELSHKPVALITASSLGEKAHESLLGTLRIIEAYVPDDLQLLISFVKTKVKPEGITDIKTAGQVQALLAAFIQAIEQKQAEQAGAAL